MIETLGSIAGIVLAAASLYTICRDSFDVHNSRRISRLAALQEYEHDSLDGKTATSYIDAERLKLRNDYLHTLYNKDRVVPRLIWMCYFSSLILLLLAFLYAAQLSEDQWGRPVLIGLLLLFSFIILFFGLILLTSENKPLGLWLETRAHENWADRYTQIKPLTPEELKSLHDVQFIDIRNERKSNQRPWSSAIRIPYSSRHLKQEIERAIASGAIKKKADTVVVGISHYHCNNVALELYRAGVSGKLMIAGQLDARTSEELFPPQSSRENAAA